MSTQPRLESPDCRLSSSLVDQELEKVIDFIRILSVFLFASQFEISLQPSHNLITLTVWLIFTNDTNVSHSSKLELAKIPEERLESAEKN